MEWLWPIKTGRTFFDVWSVVHFAFWLVVGANVETFHQLGKLGLGLGLLLGMTHAFFWEVIERYIEIKYPVVVKFHEAWWNRWISDPLMCLLGMAAGFALISVQG